MTNLNNLWATVLLSAVLCGSCTKSQNAMRQVWIGREDHGDKPGVEYRLWLDDESRIVGEMWLFTTDENDRYKELGKYPITIKASEQKQMTFTCTSGDGSVYERTIRFLNGLHNRQEQAVIEDASSQRKQEWKFERSDP